MDAGSSSGDDSDNDHESRMEAEDAPETTIPVAPEGMLSTRQRKAMCETQRGGSKTVRIKIIEPTRMSSSRSSGNPSRLEPVSCSSTSSGGAAASSSSTVAQDDHKPVSNKAQRIESAPPPIPPEGDLLDDRDVADTDELYSENERALTKFIKLHPMLRYARRLSN